MTPREKLIAVLNSGPILAPDALVVLCGEDALPRLEFAMGKVQEFAFWAQRANLEEYAPPLVLSGGLHDEPAKYGAEELVPKVLAAGLEHDRIMVDAESTNTREQAVKVVALAMEHGWRRIMLVMSPYHAPRAFLTFLKAAMEAGVDKALEINMAPATHVPWWKAPDGIKPTRFDLLDSEIKKTHDYAEHLATWQEGLAYLEYWETREEARI